MNLIQTITDRIRGKQEAEAAAKRTTALTYAELVLRALDDGKLTKAEQDKLEEAALARGIPADQVARDVELAGRIVHQLKAHRELGKRTDACDAARRHLDECLAERQRLWRELEDKSRAANAAHITAMDALDEAAKARRLIGELVAGTVFADAVKL